MILERKYHIPGTLQTFENRANTICATVEVWYDDEGNGNGAIYTPFQIENGVMTHNLRKRRLCVCDMTSCDHIDHAPGFGQQVTCLLCLDELT